MLNFVHISNAADCRGPLAYLQLGAGSGWNPARAKANGKTPIDVSKVVLWHPASCRIGTILISRYFPKIYFGLGFLFGFWFLFFFSLSLFLFLLFLPLTSHTHPCGASYWDHLKTSAFQTPPRGKPPHWNRKRPLQVELKESILLHCVHLSKLIKTWELGFQPMPRSSH